MNNLNIEDPLYSKKQVQQYLGGYHRTTIDKWIRANKFPKADLYIGHNPRWKLSTLNAFRQEKENSSN